MSKKVAVEVTALASSKSTAGLFVVILSELKEKGGRKLPISIGIFEARAIAAEMEGIQSQRPMTHDLFANTLQALDAKVEEVNIVELKDNVFYAILVVTQGDKRLEIDARPSDAIALALRFKSPIYVYEEVMQEAGIDLQEVEAAPVQQAPTPPPSPLTEKRQKLRLLEKELEEAIKEEAYERAADLRDKIEKLKQEIKEMEEQQEKGGGS